MSWEDVKKLADEAYVLHAEQRDKEALEKLEEAIKLDPVLPAPQFLKGIIRLAHGDYKEGWPLFELRHERKDVHPFCLRHLKKPMWDGKGTTKKVLIWGSEGLGDTIQMLRFLPDVVQRCPHLQVEVQFPLWRMVQYNYPGLFKISTVGEHEDDPEFDFQCSIMSLPSVLGMELSDIRGHSYLAASPPLIADWKIKKPKHVYMGLAWSGNNANTRNHIRSLPVVGGVQPLTKAFDFIPIQREYTPFDDIADMAGLIANLDKVVTIDTAVAHLAGAMGKETHLMLSMDCDWRWMQGRKDSPWYDSIKIYRQEKAGDWSNVVNEVINALGEDRPIVTSTLDLSDS